MLQSIETIWPLVQATQAVGSGEVCVPASIVLLAIGGYGVLTSAVAVQWRAGQAREKRIADELEKSQERLYQVLREREIKERAG